MGLSDALGMVAVVLFALGAGMALALPFNSTAPDGRRPRLPPGGKERAEAERRWRERETWPPEVTPRREASAAAEAERVTPAALPAPTTHHPGVGVVAPSSTEELWADWRRMWRTRPMVVQRKVLTDGVLRPHDLRLLVVDTLRGPALN